MNRLLRAELFKLTSLRSMRIAIALSVVGVGLLGCAIAAAGPSALGPAPPDPVELAMEYFAYAMMVVFTLAVTGDMGHGTYRITLGQVANPTRVFLAKLAISAGLGALLGLVAFAVVAAGVLIADRDSFASTSFSECAVSIATVPLAAMLSVGLATLIRQTAAALTSLMLWSLGLETVLVLTLPPDVGAYLPFKTIGASRLTVAELGMWEGVGLFTAYAAAVVLIALVLQSRRDAPAR